MNARRKPNFVEVVAVMAVAACAGGFTVEPAAAATNATNRTVHRPLSDFLSTQGTTSVFIPPVPDYSGTSDPALNIFALIDYAGLAAQWLVDNGGPSLGTTVDGTITERALNDGRAMVTLHIRTTNALSWAIEGFEFATAPEIFGNRAQDVLLGAEPALANSVFRFEFINTAPGAPIPDLVVALALGMPPPGFELRFYGFHCVALGPLPDGEPAQMVDTQTGVFFPNGQPFEFDVFPAEHIFIHAVGGERGDGASAAPELHEATWGAIKEVFRR